MFSGIYSVNVIYGETGKRTWGGMDLSAGLQVQLAGESEISPWEREVSLQHESVLMKDVLELDKYIKYNLLASNVLNEKGVTENSRVDLLCSGHIKEIRIDGKVKKGYRSKGKVYLGKRA